MNQRSLRSDTASATATVIPGPRAVAAKARHGVRPAGLGEVCGAVFPGIECASGHLSEHMFVIQCIYYCWFRDYLERRRECNTTRLGSGGV